jgi:sterol 3beta-glucosyltransferase
MRVGIQGWGSEGDLRPLVALAAGLARAGHEPRLVLTPIDGKDYRPLCREFGVPLRTVPDDLTFSLEGIARDAQSQDPSKLSRALLDLAFYPYLEAMYEAALELCADCDVVVAHLSSWYVKAAAQKTGSRFATVHYYPGIVPSRFVSPPILPPWPWLNRPGWALVRLMLDLAFRKPAAEFFARKGLPRVRHALPDVMFSERLNLFAASPALFPRPADWGANHALCGDFVLPDGAEDWQPSASLRAFLDRGAPPCLVTLGSMEHMAADRSRTLMIASARESNLRVVIQTKSAAHAEEGADGDIYFLPWAPHRRLMPLCSAVVHHGGAGTTHAALRAGKPSVVLPFIFEQSLWGKLLCARGVAAPALSFWKATPAAVAARMREGVERASLSECAAALSKQMNGEDGLREAARHLEGLASLPRPAPIAVPSAA